MASKSHTAHQRGKIALTFFDEVEGAQLPLFALETEKIFLPPLDAAPFAALSSGRPNLQCQPHCGQIAIDVGVVVKRGTPRARGELAA